jgi:hypothetical protein
VSRLQRGQGTRFRFAGLHESRTTPRPGGLDRTADRVFVLADDDSPAQPWLLVCEFQAQHDEDKLDSTLVEVAQFRARERHDKGGSGKYKAIAGLVYLAGECPNSVLDMTLTGGAGTRHAALVWNVAADSASAALDELEAGTTTWGILFWIALMKGAGDKELVRRWLRLTRLAPASELGDLRGVVLIFAELAGCRPVWQDELEDWNVTESSLVNSWRQQAAEKKGLEQGRAWLLDLIQGKFPDKLTPDVIQTINAQPSLPLLETWFKAAVQAATYEDFVAVLRQ